MLYILENLLQCHIKMRAAFLTPILPRVIKEGENKKAALILMKNSHFDRTLLYRLWGIVWIGLMSPSSEQCQNLCLLNLAFITDWRVVTDLLFLHSFYGLLADVPTTKKSINLSLRLHYIQQSQLSNTSFEMVVPESNSSIGFHVEQKVFIPVS